MNIPKNDLIAILAQFNPWWRSISFSDLPTWKRAPFNEIYLWTKEPPAPRALLLSGPRQVGKTTLVLQTIERLIQEGINPSNILYATFDHPLFKIAGVDAVINAWRELEPKREGIEYLFLDEAQFISDFGTWTKHQVDFFKQRRIIFTGSAMPLIEQTQESGVGRWHTVAISTLSFYEYLQIKKIQTPKIQEITSLSNLQSSSAKNLLQLSEATEHLIGHFHEYLCRGGFPQTALVENVHQAQRLLREDIIDKVLKRDMTALFGVRRILELEQMFIYLCMHDGGIQDPKTLSNNLGITKPTVIHYIDLLESTHLLYRLTPYGYGKDVLRARYKLYLADAALAPAILLKGKTLIEDTTSLGHAAETAVFNHLRRQTREANARYSYWLSPKEKELDLVVESRNSLIAFEVKYQSQETTLQDIQGLTAFCKQKRSLQDAYVLTKDPRDIGMIEYPSAKIMRCPASLFCYLLGKAEIDQEHLL